MTANIGNVDRIIRLILGAILVLFGALGLTGGVQIAAIVAGIVLLATAGTRFCLLYRLAGVNTCKI
ncbi:DUF2892 domain-containing protein [Mangrovicoccus sp. HB161399]|uniref:YgaP family membrane protein n=1 Tax=Mangrovicoccus sp. HB161399 TaxID=2720392 RepID=UPI00155515B2|nr:DUF2892 domain-containing protein [Mangrovicoccus sp. HB161399]